MQDSEIVDLYFRRDETAVGETQRKYEKYCMYIANNILRCREDAEECTNDAYCRLWELIPPARPEKLSTFLAKIVRGLAVDRLRSRQAFKRGGSDALLALDELEECVGDAAADLDHSITLKDSINRFLGELPRDARVIFLQRYWYMCSVRDIARDLGFSESKVKTTLLRTRDRLRQHLEKEGFSV